MAAFVIGLPLLYFIALAQSFGSSAGDYYNLSGIYISLIEHNSKADSSNFKLFHKTERVDTSRQYGLYIFFNTNFYSGNLNGNSALMAAHEPGREGCKEKIKSISCTVTNLKTGIVNEITSQLYLPDDMPLFLKHSSNSLFKNSKICLNNVCGEEAMLFEGLEDFKLKFNSYSSELSHSGLGDDPLLFYVRKQSFNRIDSAFKVTLTLILSDGSAISGSALASIN